MYSFVHNHCSERNIITLGCREPSNFIFLFFSIELKKAEVLDVPAEKERINSEIEKLNKQRVEIVVKIQTDVKVLWCVRKVYVEMF